jgi:hypothetical protein
MPPFDTFGALSGLFLTGDMLNMTHFDTVGPILTGEMLNFFNPHLGTAVNVAQIRGPLIMTAANDRLRHFGYQLKKKKLHLLNKFCLHPPLPAGRFGRGSLLRQRFT